MESERLGGGKWRVIISGSREKGIREWEERRKEEWKDCLVGASDASGEGMGIGVGGGLWEEGRLIEKWSVGLGRGLDVSEGETSAKRWPASDTVVLRPDSPGRDSASCGSCASCTHAPHLM